jgi:hypothetical protein
VVFQNVQTPVADWQPASRTRVECGGVLRTANPLQRRVPVGATPTEVRKLSGSEEHYPIYVWRILAYIRWRYPRYVFQGQWLCANIGCLGRPSGQG